MTWYGSTPRVAAHPHDPDDVADSVSDFEGSVSDAQVPESAVTQHEAALSILQSQIADLGEWQDWAPTYTNLTIGANGVVVARYSQDGKTVHARWSLILGSDSVMGTGPRLTLPVTAAASYLDFEPLPGRVQLRDANGSNFLGQIRLDSTSRDRVEIRGDSSAGSVLASTGVTATAPFIWAAGDVIAFTTTYEAA